LKLTFIYLSVALLASTVSAQGPEGDLVGFLDTLLAESDSVGLVVDPALEGAILSMESGETEAAVAELHDIVLQSPDHLQALRLQVSCYLRLRDYENAIASCLQISALDSLDTTAHTTLAFLYQALGNGDNAELYYSLVLDKDPDAYLAMFGLGWIHLDRRNFDAAHEAATRITEIAPDYAPNYVLLGRVLTVKGFYKEAARAYRRGFNLDSALRIRYGILLQELTIRHRLSR
jgi:tetratricopeptide (TPR) repeat protein